MARTARKTPATAEEKGREAGVVSENEDLSPFGPNPKALTTTQVAARLGMSIPWVKLHARELGGTLTRRGYLFGEDVTLERVTERVTLGRHTKIRLEKDQHDGAVAADVFELLNGGATLSEIVIGLKLHPTRVLELTKLWVKCGALSENELAVIQGRRSPPRTTPSSVPSAPSTFSLEGSVEANGTVEVPEIPAVDPVRQERERSDIASLLAEVEREIKK